MLERLISIVLRTIHTVVMCGFPFGSLSLQGAETRARPRGPLAQVGGAVTDQCKEGGHLARLHQPRGKEESLTQSLTLLRIIRGIYAEIKRL